MAKDDTDIVSALRTALADRVGTQRFELWFGASTRLEFLGDALVVHAPSLLFANWIRANFREDIEAACRQSLGGTPKLEIRVADEPGIAPATAAESDVCGPCPDNASRASPSALALESPSPAQAPSNMGSRRKFANLSMFVVGMSNRMAHASAEMVGQRPGEFSPLVLWGPTGVGKTHLLEGIWTAARRGPRPRTVLYLSAEQFVTGFLQALRGSGLPSFRQKYRGVDVLLIDDLQVLCGKRCTQVEFQYTLDTLLRDGRQIVIASDRPPSEMPDLGPELIARLESGMVCRIDPPEHETRRGIVARMAQRLGIQVPDDVQEFIASRMTHHARELSGALCRLHAASQAWHKPITLPMAQEALADLVRSSSRAVRLADIDKAVCEAFRLEPNSLQSQRKAKTHSHPRMLAMWLARKYTRAALSEIGDYFGGRSHSTVVSAQKRVDGWLNDGIAIHLADQTLHAEDAIRQVEQLLQAG